MIFAAAELICVLYIAHALMVKLPVQFVCASTVSVFVLTKLTSGGGAEVG